MSTTYSHSEDSYTLANEHVEAVFTVKKGIRLSEFRHVGSFNLLRESEDMVRGLKTWVMMPSDIIGLRDMLSEEEAEITHRIENGFVLATKELNEWGLKLSWQVTLGEQAREVHIKQKIENHSRSRFHLGVWPIAAIPSHSRLRIPIERAPSLLKNHPNHVAVFPYTKLGDSRILNEASFIDIRVERGNEEGSIKFGYVQKNGRVQAIRSESIIELSSPYYSDAEYPEGGMNVTIYASPSTSNNPFGEIEVMGTLEHLLPGAEISMPLKVIASKI